MRIHPAEVLQHDPVWLLEITLGGLTFRWSSEPLDISTEDGRELRYDSGLDLDVTLAYELVGNTPDLLQIPLELLFPISVADLVARGFDLSSAKGELSLWVEGRTYEQRLVVVIGDIDAPEYDVDGVPVRFSLRQAAFEDATLIPEAGAIVTDTNMVVYDDAVKDRYYPIVFGTPGYSLSAGVLTTGSPALRVRIGTNELLISSGKVRASQVTIVNQTLGYTYGTKTVQVREDGHGRVYSYVEVPESPAIQDGDELWTRWDLGASMTDPFERDQALEGACSLMWAVLSRSSIRLDAARFAEAAVALNAYKVSGYIDEAVKPWDWVLENVLPILPCSMVYGPSGLYPVVWRALATEADAIAHLIDGVDAHFVGPVKYERHDIVNRVRLQYAPRADQPSEFRATAIVSGATGGEDAHLQALAMASETRYGPKELLLKTQIVYDRSTAYRIAFDQIALNAQRRRTLTFEVGWKYAFLERGSVVLVTVAALRIERKTSVVQSIQYGRTGLSVSVVLS